MTKKKNEEVEIKEKNISNENNSTDEEQNPKNKTAQMFVDFWDKAGSFHHTNKLWGYPTLFEEYDKLTSGLQKSELTVVAARHSMGKTTFITNIASALISQKIPVLYISYKLSEEKIVNRFLSAEAEVNNIKIKQNTLSSKDWEKISEAINRIAPNGENSILEILGECNLSYAQLFDKIREFKIKNEDGVVIIDDFQLIPLTGKEDRYAELSALACSIKRLAVEIKLPIVLTAQVSRKCEERNDKRPQLSDLSECDALAQYSDNLLFIYRDDYYYKEDDREYGEIKRDVAEIIVAKHKNGPRGKFELLFMPHISKYKNPIKSSEIF